MKLYELTALLDPEMVVGSNYETTMAQITSKIVECGGKIVKVENLGEKRLAYSILGKERAVHTYLNVTFEDSHDTVKLAQFFNTYDPILRYLLVQTDNRKQGLPTEIVLTEQSDFELGSEIFEPLNEEINNYLSDTYGYCVKDYSVEIKVKKINWDLD